MLPSAQHTCYIMIHNLPLLLSCCSYTAVCHIWQIAAMPCVYRQQTPCSFSPSGALSVWNKLVLVLLRHCCGSAAAVTDCRLEQRHYAALSPSATCPCGVLTVASRLLWLLCCCTAGMADCSYGMCVQTADTVLPSAPLGPLQPTTGFYCCGCCSYDKQQTLRCPPPKRCLVVAHNLPLLLSCCSYDRQETRRCFQPNGTPPVTTRFYCSCCCSYDRQ